MTTSIFRAWVYNDDRDEAWPVDDFRSISIDMGKFGDGTATIEVPASAYWLSQTGIGIGSPEYGALLSFDLYWQDMTTPLFSGPVDAVTLREDRGGNWIVFSCQTFWAHFLTRRIEQSTNGAKIDLTANKADYVLYSLMNRSGYDSALAIISSTGYPGGVSRQDWGPWTVTMTDVSAPGSHGTTINRDIADGRRVYEEVMDLLEAHDMAMTITESPAGTFNYEIDTTYQNNDYTDEVVLDLRRGTATGYSETIDYSALENVLQVKGSGSGSGQNQSWTSNGTSITNYGVFEGSYTIKEADASFLTDLKTSILGEFGSAIITFDTTAVDQPGATFNSTYGIRDLVTIRSELGSRSATKLVVGCKVSVSPRTASAQVVLGQPPRNYTRETELLGAVKHGRGRGNSSKYRSVSGN